MAAIMRGHNLRSGRASEGLEDFICPAARARGSTKFHARRRCGRLLNVGVRSPHPPCDERPLETFCHSRSKLNVFSSPPGGGEVQMTNRQVVCSHSVGIGQRVRCIVHFWRSICVRPPRSLTRSRVHNPARARPPSLPRTPTMISFLLIGLLARSHHAPPPPLARSPKLPPTLFPPVYV